MRLFKMAKSNNPARIQAKMKMPYKKSGIDGNPLTHGKSPIFQL